MQLLFGKAAAEESALAEVRAEKGGLEVSRLESASAESAAAEESAAEEASAEAGEGRQGSSKDEQRAEPETPQEPVLRSGIGQEAASIAEGEP